MFVRHVLVATDFSSRSRAALGYALRIARQLAADVDLLHVLPPPPNRDVVIDAYLGRSMPEPDEATVLDTRRRLEQLLAGLPHEGTRIGYLVEPGDPAATIVRMATELPADLIVLGTHARTGVAELLLGSVAHRVITCAPCPVVTLRGDEPVVSAPSSV